MIEKHIQKLNLNPFIIGLIFQSFYHGYNKGKCSILIHYLVSALVLFKETRILFETITKNASLGKIIDDNAIAFIDFQKRIWKIKELSNLSLISLHNDKKIELQNEVQIIETFNYEKSDVDFRSYLRSAHYLGILFRDFEVQDIYKAFKVIP